MTVREDCYRRMKEHMREKLRLYYERHPQRLFDDRGTEAVEISLQGLDGLFDILNEYPLGGEPPVTKDTTKK